jgi:Putative zinc-finger/FecR protein
MFEKHVSANVAALMDGQLGHAEAARAERHLATCAACRAVRDRYQFAADMLARMPLVEAPASIWTSLEADLARGGVDSTAPESSTRGQWGFPRLRSGQVRAAHPYFGSQSNRALALAAAVVLATIASVAIWQLTRTPTAWDVVRLDTPGGETRMAIGEWVETDPASSARIRIGAIGTVDIAPNTRMQLLAARPDEHRLNLARGSIYAQILAPPRLFFVETPSSTVVDLGCAYTMDVDEAGAGLLRVTSGWASLEWDGRESVVPAGASCATRPDVGPATPSFDDASERLRQALVAFDFAGGGVSAVNIVLAEARARDTLTLWHLLSRVDASDRARVFDRMVALTALPPGVTRDGALALDADTLTRWREELAWGW